MNDLMNLNVIGVVVFWVQNLHVALPRSKKQKKRNLHKNNNISVYDDIHSIKHEKIDIGYFFMHNPNFSPF